MAVYFKGVKSSYGLTPLPYLSEFTVEITFKTNYIGINGGAVWQAPTIFTSTGQGNSTGQLEFGIRNGYISYTDLATSYVTSIFVSDNKYHNLVVTQKSNIMNIYLENVLVNTSACASNNFGKELYIGCDNTFKDSDYYSNPNKITIIRVHFFEKEIQQSNFFDSSIKDQSFCYCDRSKKENGIIKIKDRSGNGNDILCYNCDLINERIQYTNFEII